MGGDTVNVRTIVRRLVPRSVIHRIRHGRGSLDQVMRLDAERFDRWMSRPDSTDPVQLDTQVMFHTHQIEKGLSHGNFRPCFGKQALADLSDGLRRLAEADPRHEDRFSWRQAMGALHEYRARHEELGQDLTYMRRLFSDDVWRCIASGDPAMGGSTDHPAMESSILRTMPFAELSVRRRSVREYADEPVSRDAIMRAVALSQTTPSVCDRQPTRVHVYDDPTIVAHALEIQRGFNGYRTPPALVLVSSDIRAFMTEGERHEAYVDGGMYAMNLLYALEIEGLAACPLNTMFTTSQDRRTRTLLRLPDNECFVMYIAVGRPLRTTPICRSRRRAADQIVSWNE